MDVLSNGRNKSQSACNKRKRKSTSTEPSKRAYIDEYSYESILSSDHYSSSPIAKPPSITNILSPDTTSKDDADITSSVTMPTDFDFKHLFTK